MNINTHLVKPGTDLDLSKIKTDYTGEYKSKKEAKKNLKQNIKEMIKLQSKLYADDRYSMLLVFCQCWNIFISIPLFIGT